MAKKPNEKESGSGTLARLTSRAKSTNTASPTFDIDLDKCVFDETQPRQAFHTKDGIVSDKDQEALEELGDSIEIHGLIHAITVCELPDGRYRVLIGERRTRACMLKGMKTIRAQIRNDLEGLPAYALQMAENTDRQDLTDQEIADSISHMITKSERNPKPMSKAEVARALKKSAGWVTRYLTFADKSKHDKWVVPGYVESPEILYLLTILPDEIQQLIYGDLSTGKLSAPLRSRNLDHYKKYSDVIINRRESSVTSNLPDDQRSHIPPMGSDDRTNLIAEAMGGSAVPAQAATVSDAGNQSLKVSDPESPGYSIGSDVVAHLRAPTFSAPAGAVGSQTMRNPPQVISATAVPCRIPMRVLEKLALESLASGDATSRDLLKDMGVIEAEIRLPSDLAVRLVKELTGKTVSPDTVGVALAQAIRER